MSSTPALAPRSTPPVRLYAKQNGVDLATLSGTVARPHYRDDVARALSGAPTAAPAPLRSAPVTGRVPRRALSDESWVLGDGPKEERIPVKGSASFDVRRHGPQRVQCPPPAVWVRFDATKTMELLTSLKKRANLQDIRLSPLTIVALAFCDAARHFPGINSSFDAAAGDVIVRRSVNLGIAADTPRGLIVPNIKGADELDLVGMAQALDVLIDKARNGTTTPTRCTPHLDHYQRGSLWRGRGGADSSPGHRRDPGRGTDR